MPAGQGPLDGPAVCRLFNRANRIDQVKTLPYVSLSDPLVERLISTLRREHLDQLLLWDTADLQRKLDDFADYYNAYR